ncbi:hypothetical protein AAA799O18_00714, partial [Marine Group I thaumarchaeote SCGC AAA799-O18]
MIDKAELNQILAFVAKRWTDLSRDPDNKAVKTLPGSFWMNSVGGPAGKGRWITTLMYTENEEDANNFKEVLLRWQTKSQQQKPSDLIR